MRRQFVLPHVARAAIAAWVRGQPFGDWPYKSFSNCTLRDLLGRTRAFSPKQKAEVDALCQRRPVHAAVPPSRAQRLDAYRIRRGLHLARGARQFYDEHGSTRGDYYATIVKEYITPCHSTQPPYFDAGGEGLALIEVGRTRVYARSSKWWPRHTSTYYLVGRNEAGTYFAHPVPRCATVRGALAWMWHGRLEQIVGRQGDVALIRASGPRLCRLPDGHKVQDEFLVHATHKPLPLPGPGERFIVARRAYARVSEATRD